MAMTITLDGSLTDWTIADRLDIAATGVPNYEVYGKFDATADSYTVALKPEFMIGLNTTCRLLVDRG